MSREDGNATLSVHDVVDKIDQVVAEGDGSVSASDVLKSLERDGVKSETVSTALAYAVEQGHLVLDWNFRLHPAGARA